MLPREESAARQTTTDIKSRRESAMRAGEPSRVLPQIQRHRPSSIAVAFLDPILSSGLWTISRRAKLIGRILSFTTLNFKKWSGSMEIIGVGPGKRFTRLNWTRGMSRKTRSLKSCRRSKEMQLPEEELQFPQESTGRRRCCGERDAS
jgi:hypothetical protein